MQAIITQNAKNTAESIIVGVQDVALRKKLFGTLQ